LGGSDKSARSADGHNHFVVGHPVLPQPASGGFNQAGMSGQGGALGDHKIAVYALANNPIAPRGASAASAATALQKLVNKTGTPAYLRTYTYEQNSRVTRNYVKTVD
jgi:hypothetical protein